MFHTSQKIPLSQVTELNFAYSQITDCKKGRKGSCRPPPPPPLRDYSLLSMPLLVYRYEFVDHTASYDLIKTCKVNVSLIRSKRHVHDLHITHKHCFCRVDTLMIIYEPLRQKFNNLHGRKERRRSAVQ